MTWSIIARDTETGKFGIAVATRFFAVGARVPYIAAGIGAIATQALVNPYYGIDGLKLFRDGRTPREIIATLIAADSGRDSRQLHVMDAYGRIASHTGSECIDWCGHVEGEDFSIAGNMLTGARVLDETARVYAESNMLPRRRRQTRQTIGGPADLRRRRMAMLDLRVDDHADPLAELGRLEQVSRERWVHFRKFLPSRKNPAGITDRAVIDAGIAAAIASQT